MPFINDGIKKIVTEGNHANYYNGMEKMPHVTPQAHMILAYMNRHGSISQIEATEDLGITKLSTRVSEMVRAGVKGINKVFEESNNRWGQPVRYMRYSLDRSVWGWQSKDITG